MNIMGKPPLGLKAPKIQNGTAKGRAHMALVKQCPCCVCGHPPPSDAHHCISGRFGSVRASDFDTIPLCKNHHQGPEGIHTAKATWEGIYGPDTDYLPVVADMLAGQFNHIRGRK